MFLGVLVFVLDIVPCFSKKVSKSVFQSIYAYANHKNKSRKYFNIGLIRKNKSHKSQRSFYC